jgi:low temperature requirement protein LtrA
MTEQAVETEHRVTPLELFFDLVFALAFTQVTLVLTDDPTWRGLAHALLVLVVLWWAWASYAWLTNTADAGVDVVLAALLVAIAAMFVAALAVPGAFGADGAVFGVAFFVVMLVHLALYALAAGDDRDLLTAVLRLAPSSLLAATLILVAGFVDGGLRTALWAVALAVGFLVPPFLGLGGWHLEPTHFVERHGLIVIIAIGESLVAAGVGTRGIALTAGVIAAAVLGLTVAASFWLAYFDFFPLRAERLLTQREGVAQIVFARDAFSYLHLPMVAGIVLFAFGTETTLAHVSGELDTIPALALCFGPAIYLSAYVLLRLRISRRLGRGRPAAAVACALLFPVALAVPALAALALVAAVWVALHAYELVWLRDLRAETRTARVPASLG